jgi:hypothetical protein
MQFIDNLLGNPVILIIGFNVLLAIGGIAYVFIDRFVMKQWVYYFADGERLFERIKVDAFSPVSVFNLKRNLRFIRNSVSYRNKNRNEIIWLAKKGTAYTFSTENTPEGKAKKIGTLWKALESLLEPDVVNQFTTEVKEKLQNPEIFVTVDLEKGVTPEGYESLSEVDIKDETTDRMRQIIFDGIKTATGEDILKVFGIWGLGVASVLIAQSLGIL